MAAGRGGGWKWWRAEASSWKRGREFKTCRKMPWLSSSCWFGFAWLDAKETGAASRSAAPVLRSGRRERVARAAAARERDEGRGGKQGGIEQEGMGKDKISNFLFVLFPRLITRARVKSVEYNILFIFERTAMRKKQWRIWIIWSRDFNSVGKEILGLCDPAS
jgi:hypothetical protein